MPKNAKVVVELEESFEDDVDRKAAAEHTETVWEERLRLMGLDDRILNIDVYTVDD